MSGISAWPRVPFSPRTTSPPRSKLVDVGGGPRALLMASAKVPPGVRRALLLSARVEGSKRKSSAGLRGRVEVVFATFLQGGSLRWGRLLAKAHSPRLGRCEMRGRPREGQTHEAGLQGPRVVEFALPKTRRLACALMDLNLLPSCSTAASAPRRNTARSSRKAGCAFRVHSHTESDRDCRGRCGLTAD